jgi:hypothetical protein
MRSVLEFLILVVSCSITRVLSQPAVCELQSIQPVLSTLFQSLGADCVLYDSLFSANSTYYHQHDGFKTKSELLGNCKSYATFCPKDACLFLQNGAPIVAKSTGPECHLLVPYLWSEIPANPRNLEPHTGWEYMVVRPTSGNSVFKFTITNFAEIEMSYSVAYNWDNPLDNSVYNWTTQLLSSTASKGECNTPISAVVTAEIAKYGVGWHQNGNAVVLAAGGLCQVAVPYAAQTGKQLSTGHMVMILKPTIAGNGYDVLLTDVFDKAA